MFQSVDFSHNSSGRLLYTMKLSLVRLNAGDESPSQFGWRSEALLQANKRADRALGIVASWTKTPHLPNSRDHIALSEFSNVTVGWIAPMALELTPAVAILENPEEVPKGNTLYHVGRVGRHWVVMVVCPRIGTHPAATVLTDMRHSFPNIKHVLVVGIAGGMPYYGPDMQQIVLGDVVVSCPQGSGGGVTHYEFGAWEGKNELTASGHMLHPSDPLLTAVNNLRAKHMRKPGTRIPQLLRGLRESLTEEELPEFNDPGNEQDYLFPDDYPHRDRNKLCEGLCDLTLSKRRGDRGNKATRKEDLPRIHYSTIGSANTLVISSEKRNELYEKHQVICFEMESAGVMGNYQALVIRGICDYADSHKNKKWQKYAAATAAAYAKEVLLLVPPARLDERAPSKPVSWVNNHSGPANQSPAARRKNEVLKKLKTSRYKDRKDRNPTRIPGTCEWFVTHTSFREWQQSKSSSMLWVSADPGCGKSVLVKHLVDFVLPTTASRTTCYFFFKDDFEDQRSVKGALCCILHQLFTQKEVLFSDKILGQFEADREGLTNSFAELWDVLVAAAEDGNAGEIVCIFDALDECDDQERSYLEKALCDFYGTERGLNLKVLITSRPYSEIRRGLPPPDVPGLPVIHLSGESDVEREKISQEINLFIKYRVENLRLGLTSAEQNLLLQGLMCVPNRTYLWVYLTLDLVERDIGNGINKAKISQVTSHVPKTVDEAYDKILSKSRHVEEAKRLLHIVVAATRPLTLKEMNFALALQECHKSYTHINSHLNPEERVHEFVRDLCGLFVTVVNGKIYLFHQTAKEFLVPNRQVTTTTNLASNLKWKHTLQPQESHRILSEICIRHLLFSEFETHPLERDVELSQYAESHIFLDYSAKNWATHLRDSQIDSNLVIESVLRICDVGSKRCSTWFRIYWTSTNTDFPEGFTSLMIASYFGLTATVEHLLRMDDVNLNCKDATYGRSALSWAAENGFDTIVKFLIRGSGSKVRNRTIPLRVRQRFNIAAKVDLVDKSGRSPLSYAAWRGHVKVVELLLRTGKANANTQDDIGATPLYYAICGDHQAVVDLLEGAGVDSAAIRSTVLFSAAKMGQKSVVEQLLASGKVDVNLKDNDGRTPLSQAAGNGHEAIVKLLLATGKADIDTKDNYGWTPLWYAAKNGHEAIVKLLLATGKADIDSKDNDGRTPLSYAAEKGHKEVVSILIKNANVNATEKSGATPLARAINNGSNDILEILLKNGAEVNYIYSFTFVSEPNLT
ncbi:hypothetical protein DL767_009231 [Monosporascus sp. MG133]|nr:hypothetical protein DL767_009231 [Monosporascus sp. MG133]